MVFVVNGVSNGSVPVSMGKCPIPMQGTLIKNLSPRGSMFPDVTLFEFCNK